MRRTYFWQICFLNLTLVGCTVIPKYQQTSEMNIPEEWHSINSEGMYSDNPDCFIWWESLNDPLLNSLIQRAAQQNLDLFIAGTRILEARAARRGKMSDLYPHVDASITCGHACYSKDALVNGILGAVFPSHHAHSGKRNINFFEIGFDADWELDLFGMTEHEINALEAKVDAAEENLYDVWITLSAEIARNYIELRSLQQRLELVKKNIESQEDSIHLTQELLTIGVANSIDVLQAEEQLNMLRAQKSLLQLSIDKTIHRLSILLSYPPAELFTELCELRPLPSLPCKKPIGLPSELLRRRPDIRKAERDLAAATESVDSAIAALFPRFSLYGFMGDISTHLQKLTHGSSITWFLAPQLLMPVFNSRLLKQDVDLNKIQAQQALFEYQKTVLTALEEVENSIASLYFELERNEQLDESQKANQQSYQLTMQLYQRGLKDYLDVLITQRSLLAAQDSHIQSETELLIHYTSLYKALGGGWAIPACTEEKSDASDYSLSIKPH
jgi:NodT family efflux transporter outer membrane factor (OMF) lipoprotein